MKPNFFIIKKNSTLPKIKFPITQHIMEKCGVTEEMLENCAVTFSMIEQETGIFRIANNEAELIISRDREKEPYEVKYTLAYQFSIKETSKTGVYNSEFCVDFLDFSVGCGKIKFPINEEIIISIEDSITKTTVI